MTGRVLRQSAALALAASLLAGCMTLPGPQPVPPEIKMPPSFAGAPAARPAELDPGWWRLAGDPLLDRLIASSLAGNPSFAEATARLAEAEALRDTVGAAFRPQLDTRALVRRDTQRWDAARAANNVGLTVLSGALVGGLEIDLAGRLAAEARGAAAQAAIAAADQDAVGRLVAVDVLRARVALGEATTRADVVARSVGAQRRLFEVATERVRLGLAPQLDAARAETELRRAEARLPEAAAEAERSRAILAALAGRAVLDDIPEQAPMLGLARFRFGDVPVDVLRNRPDVRASEAALIRAAAARDLAAADLLPRLTLEGSLALGRGLTVGGLASAIASVGPVVTVPIFDRDIRLARLAAADHAVGAALANHVARLTTAAAEVRRALASLESARAERARLEAALAAAERADGWAEAAYRTGIADLSARLSTALAVTDVELAILAAHRAEAEALAAVLLATAAG